MKAARHSRKPDTFLVPKHSVFLVFVFVSAHVGVWIAALRTWFAGKIYGDAELGTADGRRIVFQAVINLAGRNGTIAGLGKFRVLIQDVAVAGKFCFVLVTGGL